MPGHAKRLFAKRRQELMRRLRPHLKKFVDILPWGFSDSVFIDKFKNSHPYLYFILNSKYKYYSKEDIRLLKRGKNRRYKVWEPDNFILFIIKDYIENVRTTKEQASYYTLEQSDDAITKIMEQEKRKLERYHKQLEIRNRMVQKVNPKHSGYLLGHYLRYRRTHPEDVDTRYIFLLEASKYMCKDTIDLLYKVNATERNFHIRHFAFLTLQKFGFEVQLRKNFKGKRFPGDTIEPIKINTPKQLLDKIYSMQMEHYKTYDIFLSHSSTDANLILKLKTVLNTQRMNVYLDWMNDQSGLSRKYTDENTARVLIERIKQSKCLMLIYTEACAHSIWTPWELGFAHALNKQVLVYFPKPLGSYPPYLDLYPRAELTNEGFIINGTDIHEYLRKNDIKID